MSRITGVVHASGAGAGRSPGEEHWTFVFTLAAWRVDDGPLRQEPLRVRREVLEEEKEQLHERVSRSRLIALEAQLIGPDAAAIETAELVATLDPPDDPELRAALEELETPVLVEDAVLGTLTLDRRLDVFVGEPAWMGKPVGVVVEATGDDLPDALATAHALWKDQAAWQARVRDLAVEQLLELKNGRWLDVGEAPVSPEELAARMSLESITVDPEGSFAFVHDDGDLFGGHAIEISGSLEEGPTHAALPG